MNRSMALRQMKSLVMLLAFGLTMVGIVNFCVLNPDLETVTKPSPVRYDYISPYNFSLLNRSNDLETLVNLSNFEFTLNNLRCQDVEDLFLLIFVHSAPNNFEKRKTIRETWGNPTNLSSQVLQLVFLVGGVKSKQVQKAIENENAKYHDIIQGNFIDSYRNLTYKHVMGLKWVTYYCQNAKYIFKADDDIFVDVFQMVNYLQGQYGVRPSTNLISCFVIQDLSVKRAEDSKWRVTYQEYPDHYYPPYCSGWGIILSPDVVFRLYLLSSQVPFFWIDDVLISGIFVHRLGLTHTDITRQLAITEEIVTKWLTSDAIVRPLLFGVPNLNTTSIKTLWQKTLQYYSWAHSSKV